VISWALGKEGFAIHSYSDPKEALKNLKKGKHIPSLMVVDFQMEGMMGSEFIRQKMQIEMPEVRECPVFLISASSEEAQEKVSSDYYVEMIDKPLDLESLVQKIKLYV
jgi:CheY-like chemotaxis protein